MRVSRDALLLFGLIAVMVVFALTIGAGRKTQSDISTSYSNDASGVKAVYTLLGERLGYATDRLLAPYTNLPKNAAVLVVVGPLAQSPITVEERNALDKWLIAGGTAVFISDSLQNVPARYGSNRRIGKGFDRPRNYEAGALDILLAYAHLQARRDGQARAEAQFGRFSS